MKKLAIFVALAVIAALLALPLVAHAANTVLWSSSKGDVNFPISPTTIDGMTIGATTPAAGTFTAITSDTGTKTAAATGTTTATATLNKSAGVITSAALTTAAAGTYTLTLTNSAIAAADQVMASVANGTSSTGIPAITTVTPGAGSVVIQVQNIAAAAALNGTIKIAFVVFKN